MSNEQQNARDTEFEDKPLDSAAMCPLNIEAAIFPVRYAIDESADHQADTVGASETEEADPTPQGPHPLPESWRGASHPELNTRTYCLRQLRDGWLYVWDETDETFHEYRIEGHQFTRIPWLEGIGTEQPDERTGGGETRPYLLYPCRSRIWLAYSSVQWTWRICEHMRSNASSRARFMRPLSIRSAVEAPESTSHVGPLTELGQHVADITPQGAVRDFESTTVMTRQPEEGDAGSGNGAHEEGGTSENEAQKREYPTLVYKPEISQGAVLGQVPNKDEAIFVALDDDLGMVNDLTMQLLGIEAAYEMFEDEHGHRLKTALMVQRLCGISESELPEGVPDDPEQQRQAIEALGDYYELKRKQDKRGNRPGPNPLPGQLGEQEAELRELGIEPETDTDAEAWQSKLIWRNDVRYDEALAFIQARQPELERLERQREQCRADLITWLDRLPLSAQELCFDGCNVRQTQALIEWSELVVNALGASEDGQAWLTERGRAHDHLIGLAAFNFSPELAEALTTIAGNFYETGEADGLEVSDATNAASRANEAKAVLGLEQVRNSRVYQALAPHVRRFQEALVEAVNASAKAAWEKVAYQLLPATGAGDSVNLQPWSRGLARNLQAAQVHPDNIARGTQLVRTGDYEARHRTWRGEKKKRQNRLQGLRESLKRPSAPHERAAQIRNLNSEQQALEELATREPKRIVAQQSGSGGGPAETLGYDELREQARLKLEQGAAAARARMNNWMNRFGGGLPLLVAGLNLFNVGATLMTIQREGLDDHHAKSLVSGLGYTTSAVMALWVMPYWHKHAERVGSLGKGVAELAKRGVSEWRAAGNTAFARTAAKLTTRVAGMAAFGAIGAAVEAWQIRGDIGNATSSEEISALYTKAGSTLGMLAIASAQTVGALLGKATFSFAWVMSAWVLIPVLIVGVVYFFASYMASYFHREGIRLWLYRCNWGVAPKWRATDEEQAAEWRALMETLSQPEVQLKPARHVSMGPSPVQGYWLSIEFPALLAGAQVSLSSNASRGFWATAQAIEQRQKPPTGDLPAAVDYAPETPRTWLAWVPRELGAHDAPFTLRVTYPADVLGTHEGKTFVFHKEQASDLGRELQPVEEDARPSVMTDQGMTLIIPR